MAEMPPTRPSLLVRLRDRGDDFAWTQFIALYGPLVYGYARKQGLQDADAADLTQETLGAVTRAVGRLEYDPKRGAFRNWLFTIVRRALSKWHRTQQNQPGAGNGHDDGILKQQPQPVAEETEWETRWQERLFAWACEKVRPEVTASTWQAFWKTAIDDQPGKQVAAELGMTVAAVYRARSRVLARIKAEVKNGQQEG